MLSPGPGATALAVTSSTAMVGVAVGPLGGPPDGATVAEVVTDRRHAEELTPLIERVLRESGTVPADLAVLVVDVGPGRFTGLRVGLATVRALALAVDRPVIGLTSLEILAAAEPDRPVVAAVDARRSQVFQQAFGSGGPDGPALVGDPAELAAEVAGTPVVGDGADRYADHYGHRVRPGRHPSAAAMLVLAADRPAAPGPEVEPAYLRDPDVTINIRTRHTPRPGR